MRESKKVINSREVREGGISLRVTTPQLWACSGLWNKYMCPDLNDNH